MADDTETEYEDGRPPIAGPSASGNATPKRTATGADVRRSAGKLQMARAVWYVRPGVAELRSEPLPRPGSGEARVRTLWSGISRGTERLVSNGLVPESEWKRMRAPLQGGEFPFPVKYGYCATGMVEEGPAELIGRAVFCLAPHQDQFVAPVSMLAPLPDGLAPRRATLAANMETALNAHWDAGTGPGDRIVVVGAGIVGLLVAAVAARVPGTSVTVVDTELSRATLVTSLGATFALAPTAPGGRLPTGESPGSIKDDADVVFHTSASAQGLATAVASAGMEGTIVELSWYGDTPVSLALGGAFHSRRLKLVSSQVGQVSASRRVRWSYRRRLDAALRLLSDPVFDALVAEEIDFAEAPRALPLILAGSSPALAPVIRYQGAE